MDFRSPLSRVRGLGAAKEGTHHWWMQRVTAVALVPLTLWFVASLLSVASGTHAEAIAWLRSPLVTVSMLALIGAGLYHAQLGLQVVLEDYIHQEWLKIAALVTLKLTAAALALGAAVAVLKVAL